MNKVKTGILLSILILMACGRKIETKEQKQSKKSTSLDLAALLDTIWENEQMPISKRDSAFHAYGDESEEYKKYQALYKKNHQLNEQKIAEILKDGWPDFNEIGEQGNLTICNVLQHSSPEIRVKYLPLMRKATKNEQLSPWLLARTEDRIATDCGELQVYGGQIKYYPETETFDVWPIVDPENVDKRRAEIGLEPMAQFLKDRRVPLEWNLEEQIKRTAEFESTKNKQE
ncbi:hypothetical protein SAMN05216294_1631 [Flagellimonas zhangzhouensis]|uniref:Uncharacterized protein n=2 Tax=Flagellimonas zhangzhouensis TaxID=1073328 RepID=A0A1H2QLV8_9FLAO|nr:hypothetical protein SAMN05216294_1631 [Allomuricauda zhangzhouensis]SDW08121.1 hypothetical protein SAMN04487892_0282 [Allomuricauda zhangzhouensis]